MSEDAESDQLGPARYRPNRPISPHHQKCFPDQFVSVLGDRLWVAKLSRDELEDKCLKLSGENILLKKRINEQALEIKRLQTTVQRLESSHRTKVSPSNRYYEDRIKQLEKSKRSLEGKIDVLKQQLQSHSRLHAQVHRNFNLNKASSGKAAEKVPETVTSTYRAHFNREALMFNGVNDDDDDDDDDDCDDDAERNGNIRIPNSKRRVGEIEEECPDDIDPLDDCQARAESDGNLNKVVENIELIRLKRLLKRQAAQLTAMSAQSEATEKEIQQLKNDCQTVAADNENISKMLNGERLKTQNLMKELALTVSLKQDVRMLEEQVRDLQQERIQLREHNEKLLMLSANKPDESLITRKESILVVKSTCSENSTDVNLESQDSESPHYIAHLYSPECRHSSLSRPTSAASSEAQKNKKVVFKTDPYDYECENIDSNYQICRLKKSNDPKHNISEVTKEHNECGTSQDFISVPKYSEQEEEVELRTDNIVVEVLEKEVLPEKHEANFKDVL